MADQETTAHTHKSCKPHTHTLTQAILLPFSVLCECALAGLQAGVQPLALFQDWSSQANSATPLTHSPFFPLFLPNLFLCYILSPSWSTASAFTIVWSVTFVKIYHIGVQHDQTKAKEDHGHRGGEWVCVCFAPHKMGGIISHASTEQHMMPPNKTNFIAKIISQNTVKAFKLPK